MSASWRRQAATRLAALMRRFAAAFSLLVLTVAIIAPHVAKVSHNIPTLIGCGLAVLSAIVFHLVDIALQVESIQKKLEQRDSEDRLLTLSEAIADLFQTLDRRVGTGPVTLNIFALHLENMSRWLPKALRQCKSRSIELKIFLVTPNLKELGSLVPYEVEKACRNMNRDLERRRLTFETLAKELKDQQRRKLSIEIKHYPCILHAYGISVRDPIQLSYIQVCRHFEVPDVEYLHRVDHATASAADNDLGDVFCGMFDHLWNTVKKPAWVYPPPKSANAGGREVGSPSHFPAARGEATETTNSTQSEPPEGQGPAS